MSANEILNNQSFFPRGDGSESRTSYQLYKYRRRGLPKPRFRAARIKSLILRKYGLNKGCQQVANRNCHGWSETGWFTGTCWVPAGLVPCAWSCILVRPPGLPPAGICVLQLPLGTGENQSFLHPFSQLRQAAYLAVASRISVHQLAPVQHFWEHNSGCSYTQTVFHSQATTVLLPSLFSCFCEVAAAQPTCPGLLGPCLQCLSQPRGRQPVLSLQPGCHGPFSIGQPAACLCGCSTCYLLESCLRQQPQK